MRVKILRRYIFLLIAVAGLVGLAASPSEAVSAGYEALCLCINAIIPALFPFFVFSSLSVSLGLADILGKAAGRVMKPVFNVNGSCASAFILGLVSGFPVGAKTAISLYKNGMCTKAEAERILSFSNNAGPAFVLGTVGIGIWNSGSVGWMLWLTQIVSSIAVGFIFGHLWKKNDKNSEQSKYGVQKKSRVVSFLPALTDAVKSSAINLIYISSFIVFFAIVIKLLTVSGVIPFIAALLFKIFPVSGLSSGDYENILSGIFEFTTGIKRIGSAAPYSYSLTITAAMLGWAGLSVHCQVLSFVYDSGLSPVPYIAGKALQTVFAAAITFVVSRFITIEDGVSVFAGYTSAAEPDLFSFFQVTAISVVLIVFIATVFCMLIPKK